MKPRFQILFVVALGAAAAVAGAELRAGAARVSITPRTPIRLGGRDAVSQGVAGEIYARALALDDGAGGRAVIITTDLMGLPRSLTERAAVEIMKAQGLERGQIVFSATGTRNAPMIQGLQPVLEPEGGPEAKTIEQYAGTLIQYLAAVAGAAIGDLKPARVDFAWGGAPARNKKKKEAREEQGREGRDLAVLRVLTPKGGVIALLFGTSVGNAGIGDEFRSISGDAAGAAEAALEKEYKGSVALSMGLCGPWAIVGPWGEEAARTRGQEMAARVDEALKGPMEPARGRLSAALIEVSLPFVPHTKEQFEKEANSSDAARARRARRMLAAYEARNEPRQMAYPVQVVRFEGGPALVALGGEAGPGYAENIRKSLHKNDVVVALNANEGSVVALGSKEEETNSERLFPASEPRGQSILENAWPGRTAAERSMMEFGWPGLLTEEAEERILGAVERAWQRAGKK
jgi:hypothetical protein